MRGMDLKAWRESRKLSQCDLAALLDISLSAVITSERRDMPIGPDMEKRLGRVEAKGGLGYLADAYDDEGALCGVSVIGLFGGRARPVTLPLTALEALDRDARMHLARTCTAQRDWLIAALLGCRDLWADSRNGIFEPSASDLGLEISARPEQDAAAAALSHPAQGHRTPWRLLAMLSPMPMQGGAAHGAAAD